MCGERTGFDRLERPLWSSLPQSVDEGGDRELKAVGMLGVPTVFCEADDKGWSHRRGFLVDEVQHTIHYLFHLAHMGDVVAHTVSRLYEVQRRVVVHLLGMGGGPLFSSPRKRMLSPVACLFS